MTPFTVPTPATTPKPRMSPEITRETNHQAFYLRLGDRQGGGKITGQGSSRGTLTKHPIAPGLADVAGRTPDLELSEGEAMKLAGGGQAAAAPDEFAATGWSRALPRLFPDEVDPLDVKKDRDGDFGRCVAKIGIDAPATIIRVSDSGGFNRCHCDQPLRLRTFSNSAGSASSASATARITSSVGRETWCSMPSTSR